jgi:hypothetical protein
VERHVTAHAPLWTHTRLRPGSDHDGLHPIETEEFRHAGWFRLLTEGGGNCAFHTLADWTGHLLRHFTECGWDTAPIQALPQTHRQWRQEIVSWLWQYQDLLGPTHHCNPEWMTSLHGWEYTARGQVDSQGAGAGAKKLREDTHAPSVQDALYHRSKGLVNLDVWAPIIVFQVAATFVHDIVISPGNGNVTNLRVFVGTQGDAIPGVPQWVRELKPILLPKLAAIFRVNSTSAPKRRSPKDPPGTTFYSVDKLLQALRQCQDPDVQNLWTVFQAKYHDYSGWGARRKNTIPHKLLVLAITPHGSGLIHGRAMPWDLVATNYPQAVHWELCQPHPQSVLPHCSTMRELYLAAVDLFRADPNGIPPLLLANAPVLGKTTNHIVPLRDSRRSRSAEVVVAHMDVVQWHAATFAKCLEEQHTAACFHVHDCEHLETIARDAVRHDKGLFGKSGREGKTGCHSLTGQHTTTLHELLTTLPPELSKLEGRIEFRQENVPLDALTSQLCSALTTLHRNAAEFRGILASVANGIHKARKGASNCTVNLQLIATAPTRREPGFVDSHYDSEMSIMIMLIGNKVWEILPAAREHIDHCTMGPDHNENADLAPSSIKGKGLPWQTVSIRPGRAAVGERRCCVVVLYASSRAFCASSSMQLARSLARE